MRSVSLSNCLNHSLLIFKNGLPHLSVCLIRPSRIDIGQRNVLYHPNRVHQLDSSPPLSSKISSTTKRCLPVRRSRMLSREFVFTTSQISSAHPRSLASRPAPPALALEKSTIVTTFKSPLKSAFMNLIFFECCAFKLVLKKLPRCISADVMFGEGPCIEYQHESRTCSDSSGCDMQRRDGLRRRRSTTTTLHCDLRRPCMARCDDERVGGEEGVCGARRTPCVRGGCGGGSDGFGGCGGRRTRSDPRSDLGGYGDRRVGAFERWHRPDPPPRSCTPRRRTWKTPRS